MFQLRISTKKPSISLKTHKQDFLTTLRFWDAAGGPKSFLYGCQNPETPVLLCAFAINYVFFFQKLAVAKTTSEYIAGLQDPFKDKYMDGKSNYKSKSL